MQRFVAVGAIGPSALRGHKAGTISAVQGCLAGVKLDRAGSSSETYAAWLDRRTVHVLNAIEGAVGGRPWGSARKALNLFLRNCLYNHYLRQAHGLARIEPFLEIPLDSVVAKALSREAGRGRLPRWRGLQNLTPEQSVQYQAWADELARLRGLAARIHLDMSLWMLNRARQPGA